MELQIKGARTQELWDGKTTALFVNEPLSPDKAREILLSQPDSVIELLYAGSGDGWESLLRSELTSEANNLGAENNGV